VRAHHLALRVADLERSRAFYGDLLGLPVLRRLEANGVLKALWLCAGELVLMLERQLRGAGPEAGSGHLLAFAVDDLPAWEARLAAAGVAIDDRTTSTLYVRDPDGHRVGFSVYRFPAGPGSAASHSIETPARSSE
jgi:catechol 2,3-dioxygenase-like lactoylglutathione lyase family enzyme